MRKRIWRDAQSTHAHAQLLCSCISHICTCQSGWYLFTRDSKTNRLLSFQSESPAEKKLLSCTGGCIPLLLLRFTSCHRRGESDCGAVTAQCMCGMWGGTSDDESESDESRCLFFFLDFSFLSFFSFCRGRARPARSVGCPQPS